MNEPSTGSLLISDPFLKDPNFMRSVVFLCDHNEAGSIGFVINRRNKTNLDEILDGDLKGFPIPVYIGGPVQMDTLHFIHSMPDVIPDGQNIGNGIFWGGNFETVLANIKNNTLNLDRIRFFIGYSGWGSGQLDEEMKEKSWLAGMANKDLVFHANPEKTWKDAIQSLGKEYAEVVNYPIDPSLN